MRQVQFAKLKIRRFGITLKEKIRENKTLIYAPGINNGGGLLLLKALREENYEDCCFVVDSRTGWKDDKNTIITRGIFGRLILEISLYFLMTSNKKTLFFSSIPSMFQFKSQNKLFLQNEYLLKDININSIRIHGIKNLVKCLVFRFCIRQDLDVIVQTDLMKKKFLEFFPNHTGKLYVGAFYPRIHFGKPKHQKTKNNEVNLAYVSTFGAHKNHKRLIEAFNLVKDSFKVKLILTITKEEFVNSLSLKHPLIRSNFLHIQFIGYQQHEEILALYHKIDCLIFPSLFESLGMPLIEAENIGIPILASHSPYVFEVCKPTSTFNPESMEAIASSIKEFLCKYDHSELNYICRESRIKLLTPKQFLELVF